MREDCRVSPPQCTYGQDCGSYYFSTLYFLSFTILSTFVVLNMVVAVVMDNFTWTYALERLPAPDTGPDADEVGVAYVGEFRMAVDDHIIVSSQDLQSYAAVWKRFDEQYTGVVRITTVSHILDAITLEQPMPGTLQSPDRSLEGPAGGKGESTTKWTLGRSLQWQRENPDYMATLHHELMNMPEAEPGYVRFDDLFLAVAYLHLEAEVARENGFHPDSPLPALPSPVVPGRVQRKKSNLKLP